MIKNLFLRATSSSNRRTWSIRIASAMGGVLLAATSLGQIPVQAARLVTLSLGAAERSIDVDDLITFATTDEIPRGLRWYVNRFEPDQVEEFRSLLATEFEIDPLSVSRFLNAPLGNILLERLLVLFRTSDPDATLKALRSALVLAAFDSDEGFSIINVIQKWPLREVELNFNVALDAIDEAEQLFVETEKVSAFLRQAAIIETANTDLQTDLPSLGQPGMTEWRQEGIRLTNPNRQGASRIAADLYLPEQSGEAAPLVVVSHGLGSNRATFAYLAEHLASHGIAVAAIEHPASNTFSVEQFFTGFLAPVGTNFFLERPRDISLLLDELETLTQEGGPLAGLIDTSNVGVLGQSLGGYTALAIGGAELDIPHLQRACESNRQTLPFNLSIELQCQLLEGPSLEDHYSLRDDRVTAVIAINPVSSVIFGPEGMAALQIPTTIVAGRNDFFAPAIPEQIFPYIWTGTSEDKYLIYVENGTHFSFLGDDGQSRASSSLLPVEMLGPEPEGAQPILQALSTAFWQRYLTNNDTLSGFYSNAYLGSVNNPPFRFYLSNTLSMDDINQAIASPLTEEGVDPLPIPFF